jgi:outer membrane receptor protein involved in Fe transport
LVFMPRILRQSRAGRALTWHFLQQTGKRLNVERLGEVCIETLGVGSLHVFGVAIPIARDAILYQRKRSEFWVFSMRNRTAAICAYTRRLQASVVLACVFFVCASAFAQQRVISGVVSDSAGAKISEAAVEFEFSGGIVRTRTDESGEFTLSSASADGTLTVQSPGFNTIKISINGQTSAQPLQIQLQPASLIERIVVNANDERIPVTPTSEYAIGRRELAFSGALTIDDVLRQVPGFSLFRRSGGLTANPTTQGVSLRGVGASGASRALVMYDGVPLNSPFGGWVYWNRLPRVNVDSVEVFNGATSDLYGSGALGGVINITSRTTTATFLDFEASAGNAATGLASLSAGKSWNDFGVGVALQALHTDGYILVPEHQRGLVDTRAGTSDLSGLLTLSKGFGSKARGFLRLGSFGESRKNGTPLQINDTRITSLDLGTDWSTEHAGDFSLRLYGSSETFNQNFSAVAPNRNSETLTNRQRNPSQQLGFAFQWRRPIGDRHSLSAGAEGRDVRGHSAETFVRAGGRQRSFGFFGNDAVRIGRWLLSFGGRVDRWLNYDGFLNRTIFTDRSETAFSPRASVLKRFDNGLSVSASVYRAFRAPTLNELYRNFRVGNIVTNANSELSAERLTGGEAGAGVQTFRDLLFIRGNVFWSQISDSIANVTLSTTPTLITRQRQNLGAIRARGVELSAILKPNRNWELSGEYLLTDTSVLRFPANRTLEGLLVPQIPRNQFNFQISYTDGRWIAATQGRFVGKQFDDDLNTLPLKRFFTLDAQVSRAVSEQLRFFVAFQNLTGARYEISSTPVLTLGPPVLVRAGVRLSIAGF